jgi:acyl-coenzyme A thioesterase PaaI-like protein
VSIVHHDLCFGCGRTNLFGLQIELDPGETGVSGRFFVKQDHQGPPGHAHGGILAAALDEAMALAVCAEGERARTARLELDLRAPAPIGSFVRLEGRVERRKGDTMEASARALGADDDALLAQARATFVRVDDAGGA